MTQSQNTRRVVVDPLTRVEGHLRVQAVLNENNVIVDSQSTGTMWRGLEVILKGRDPRDAWAFVPVFTRWPPYVRWKTQSASRFRKTPTSSAT